jgi:hypothetical protein
VVLNLIEGFFCVYWDDQVILSLLLLMCCITFIDLHMLNHLCIPGMKLTWSWWMIFLICCWTEFTTILLSIFALMFIGRLAYSSLFGCVFVQYGDKCNTSFIKRVRQCSFLFYFMEKFKENWCLFFFKGLLEFRRLHQVLNFSFLGDYCCFNFLSCYRWV